MRSHYFTKKIGGAALMLAMLLGVGLVSTASAQIRYDDRYGYGRNNDQVRWTKDRTRQYAYLLGYHQAYTEGSEARENGYNTNYKDAPGYRNDANGWLAWMGYQSDYRSRYRDGYRDGFNDGANYRTRRYDRDDVERVLGGNLKEVYQDDRWDRYDRRDRRNDRRDDRWDDRNGNRNGRYNRQEILRIAQQNAYNDGMRHGQDDRRRNRSYNYSDSGEYRNATNGYRPEYGDREVYRQGYREGYQRGYNDGYRNTTGNRRWPWSN